VATAEEGRLLRPGEPVEPVVDLAHLAPGAGRTQDDDSAGKPGHNGSTYLWLGRRAWATLGMAGVLVLAGIVLGRLTLVVVPVVLALFPAALLLPLAHLLKRWGAPPALASLMTILILLAAFVGIITGVTMLVQDELPELQDSLTEGIADLEQAIESDPLQLGYDFPGFEALLASARNSILGGGAGQAEGDGEGDGEGAGGGPLAAATAVTEGLTGLLLLFVALFFYLKDEGRLAQGAIATLPRGWQPHVRELANRFWNTVGQYFRGQILIAAVDAVSIGLGLLLLGVPLALPLAVLVFFGALFPIVGSITAGAVAVLVALADAGPVQALLVLGLIVVVQQVEGNVLQPLVMSNATHLHPLMVILALTAGSVLQGILGAFLAVPIAAGIARALDYARLEMGRAALLRPGEA
jgi:predicted PurR-regulated permease PerM